MLDLYLNEIKQGIKTHDLVKKNPLLNGAKWKKSSYDQLSNILSSFLSSNLPPNSQIKLGTTISAKTLSNIYKGQYKLSYPIDPRTLNTLTKLIIFLGHEDWDAFVKTVDEKQKEKLKKASPEEIVIQVVKEALEAEFKIYNTLPNYDVKQLAPYFLTQESAFKKILDVLNQKQKDGWTLSNPYNPSTFELLDISLIQFSKEKAKIQTNEYWLLCWWNFKEGKYVRRYKDISEHYYILKKTQSVWKIKTNATLADFND